MNNSTRSRRRVRVGASKRQKESLPNVYIAHACRPILCFVGALSDAIRHEERLEERLEISPPAESCWQISRKCISYRERAFHTTPTHGSHPIFVPLPWGTTGVGAAAAALPEAAAEAATGVAAGAATAGTVTEAAATGAEDAAEEEGSAAAAAGGGSRTLATRRLTTGTGSSGGASGGRYGPPTST